MESEAQGECRFTHPENTSELELVYSVAYIVWTRDVRFAVLAVVCSGWFVPLTAPTVSGFPQPVDFKPLFVRNIRFLR